MADEKKVNVIGGVAAVAADGHGIGINPENGVAQLIFIQVTNNQMKPGEPVPKELQATAVASVRLSLEQLEKLKTDIEKNIEFYKASKTKPTVPVKKKP